MIPPPVCRCRSTANLRYRKLPPRNRLAGRKDFCAPRSPFLLFPSSLSLFSFLRRSLRFDTFIARTTLKIIPFRVIPVFYARRKNTILSNIVFPSENSSSDSRKISRAKNLFHAKFLIFVVTRDGVDSSSRINFQK